MGDALFANFKDLLLGDRLIDNGAGEISSEPERYHKDGPKYLGDLSDK